MDFDSAVNNFNQALLGSAQMIAASNTSHEDRRLIREQNDLSRQWNEKVWHMQNEYNLPKNQLARLVDSGLNPALMYGQATTGLAQNVNGSYGAASTNPSQLPQAIGNVQNSMIARENFQVQMDNVRASTDLMRSQAIKNSADADLARADILKGQRDSYSQFYKNQLDFQRLVDIEKPKLQKYFEQVDMNIEQARHYIANLDADTKYKGEKSRQVGVDINNSILTTMQNLENMRKSCELMNSQIFNNIESGLTQRTQRSYLKSLGAFYDANTDRIKKLTSPEVKKAAEGEKQGIVHLLQCAAVKKQQRGNDDSSADGVVDKAEYHCHRHGEKQKIDHGAADVGRGCAGGLYPQGFARENKAQRGDHRGGHQEGRQHSRYKFAVRNGII